MAHHLERMAEPSGGGPGYGAWLAAPEAADDAGRVRHYLRMARDQRRTLLGVTAAVVALVALATALAKPMYESTATVLVRGQQGVLPPAASAVSSAISGLVDVTFDDSLDTQIAILESKTITDRALEACGLAEADPSAYRIDVSPEGNARVAEVRVRARRPELSARLANRLVAEYLALDREINQESAGQAAAFVREQLEQVEKRLGEAEEALRDFKEESGAVALDSQTEEMVRRFAEVEAAYQSALSERASSEARIGQVREQLTGVDPSVVASLTVAPSPEAKLLRETLTQLETQRADLLQDYLPTSRAVRAIDEQIEDAKDRLAALSRQEADTIISERRETLNPIHQSLLEDLGGLQGSLLSAQVRSRLLGDVVRRQQTQLARLPQKQFTLANLTRDVQTYARLFTLLTAKHQELQITQQSELPTARQLDVAEANPERVSPRWLLNLVLAAMLGAVLAVLAALTRDHLDERVKSDGDVAHALGAPVVGHVLAEKNAPTLVSDGQQPSPMGEAYRMLRSNVMLSAAERPMQTVLVTSAAPQEGKSMTAANLAVVMAKQGRSVILVDGDLRRPTLHERFGVDNQVGLSTALAGEAGVEQALQETKIENLLLLPSGPPVENAADLLASEPAQRLIAALRQRADYVVFDSPPSVALSDAQVLASRLDGVLLVVDTEVGLRRGLLRLREQMEHAGARVIGAVLNRVDPRRGAFGETYYRYYREYFGPGPRQGRRPEGGRPSLPPTNADAMPPE